MQDSDSNRLPEGTPTLRVMPMPADANIHGDVFGGWIMSQVDIAGAIPAVRRANGRVGTVAVNSFLFKQPVFVGDLLSFYARIIKTGTTSVTVTVEVYAERNRLQSEIAKILKTLPDASTYLRSVTTVNTSGCSAIWPASFARAIFTSVASGSFIKI